MPRRPVETYAAIDLGSNSFHMLVARSVHREVAVVDRLKEMVRLAAGLDERRRITPEAEARALDCLGRFRQRMGSLPDANVRAVGTNTLRTARNARGFLERASDVLGHSIEVISGQEEARLIYLGVAHDIAGNGERRLVVDIGGGSTECVVGQGFEPLRADSLYMGCVGMSQRFFAGGRISRKRLERAELAARREVEPIARRYRGLGWRRAYGASGTVAAVARVLEQTGLGSRKGGITPGGLGRLRRRLLEAGSADALDLPGLKAERRPVFAGGVAVLSGIFTELGIGRMRVAGGALREGVLYDLLGRVRDEDRRERTILHLVRSFSVELVHAERVERTALALLGRVARGWGLGGQWPRRLLSWAARLFEVGLAVAYSGYHRHGAYLLANADMPGFSRDDQVQLAALVRVHRRKLRREAFEAVGARRREEVFRLALLLRLAVLFHRGRTDEPLPEMSVEVSPGGIALAFPPGWLEAHPLTEADLAEEQTYLARAGVRLGFS